MSCTGSSESSSYRDVYLLIVRHGESEANVVHRMDGVSNTNLTEKGKKQAIKVGEKLRQLMKNSGRIHVWASSDIDRAVQTAELAAMAFEPNEIPGHRKDSILQERNFGVFDGRYIKEWIEATKGKDLFHWYLWEPEGSEGIKELQARAKKALENICFSRGFMQGTETQNPLNVVIFSHGCFIMEIITVIQRLHKASCPHEFAALRNAPENTGISSFRIRVKCPIGAETQELSPGDLEVEWLLFHNVDHLTDDEETKTVF